MSEPADFFDWLAEVHPDVRLTNLQANIVRAWEAGQPEPNVGKCAGVSFVAALYADYLLT
jgi:hypothetical protein